MIRFLRNMFFSRYEVAFRRAGLGILQSVEVTQDVGAFANTSDLAAVKEWIQRELQTKNTLNSKSLVVLLMLRCKTEIAKAFGWITAFLISSAIVPLASQPVIGKLGTSSINEVVTDLVALIFFNFISWICLNHSFDSCAYLSTRIRFLMSRVLVTAPRIESARSDSLQFFGQDLMKIEEAWMSFPLLYLTSVSVLACALLNIYFLGFFGLLGVVAVGLLVIISERIAARIKNLSSCIAQANGKRMGLSSFFIDHFESIKSSLWTKTFAQSFAAERTKEERAIGKSFVPISLLEGIFAISPYLVTFGCVVPFIIAKGDAAHLSQVIPALIVLGTLRSSFANLPPILISISAGQAYMDRLAGLLTRVYGASDNTTNHGETYDIRPYRGSRLILTGKWTTNDIVNLISGNFGGEKVSFVSQENWVFKGSLAENIVCDGAFDEGRLNEVVTLVELFDDFGPSALKVQIATSGQNISGGQRARICLARALYANNPVTVLDSTFSSLDPAVRERVFANTLKVLQGSTLIYVSELALEIGAAQVVLAKKQSGEFSLATQIPTHAPISRVAIEHKRSRSISNDVVEVRKTGIIVPSLARYLRIVPWRFPLIIAAIIVGVKEFFAVSADTLLSSYLRSPQDVGVPFMVALKYFGYVVGSAFLALILFWGILRFSLRIAGRIQRDRINAGLQKTVARFRLLSHAQHASGLIHDQRILDQSIGQKLLDFVAALAAVSGSLGLILFNVPVLLGLLPPLGFLYFTFGRRYQRAIICTSNLKRDSQGDALVLVGEYLDGLSWLRPKGSEHWGLEKVQSKFADLESLSYIHRYFERWLSLRLELIGVCIFSCVAVLPYVVDRHYFGNNVELCLSYAFLVTAALGRVVRARAELDHDLVSVHSAIEGFGITEQRVTDTHKRHVEQVSFQGVCFSYSANSDPIFAHVNFQLPYTTRCVVTGRTGSGKSSFLKLLLGHYEPTVGRIEGPSRRFAILQDPILFPGELILSLAPPGTIEDEIWNALQAVGASEMVRCLPFGLKTDTADAALQNIGTKGRRLLLAASAILHKPGVLVVDEITGGFDGESARKVMGAMFSALPHTSIFMITHDVQFRDILPHRLECEGGGIRCNIS